MRVFINSPGGIEGKNLGVLKDIDGDVIGLSVELPTYNIAGAVDLVLTNNDRSSEFVIPNGFIYLDIGNTLTIDTDGVTPNFKKETEAKPITITGRNIGYVAAANYDNISDVQYVKTTGYQPIAGIPEANNITSYKVEYKGIYTKNGVETPVSIIRQINIFIDGDAKITGTPTFSLSKDTLVVNPSNVNLDPNQPKDVDVTIKTTTIVYKTGSPADPYFYSRKEEYTKAEGFTYIPDEVTPTIESITPDSGPSTEELFMTLKGINFQVMEKDGAIVLPTIKIGGRDAANVKVYDSQNRLVDGKKIQIGTRITFTLPAGIVTSGAVDVVVRNPSQGQDTLDNGFTFKNPDSQRPMPKILSLKEAFGDMRGGVITGETILITGENFDAALEGDHRVFVTIGGEKAEIKGKVSADGKTVTVIPPPAMVEGKTTLQLINEDGSMAEAEFEYRRAVTSPKITKIVPIKGGKGTKLVIKGEDFVFPDLSTNHDDPKHKGTIVLLNGKELNAYNYDEDGGIISDGTDIYFNNTTLQGKMVEVQDSSTIYVDVPENFYSYSVTGANYLQANPVPLGALTVEVLNPDGTKSKEQVTFTFLKPATFPTITSITPANGSINGGTIVTIKGTNFKQDDLQIFFASEEAEDIQYINTTELRVKVPIYPYDLPSGKDKLTVPVMVMNYDGGAAVRNNGFEYRIPGSMPVITSLTPARGSAAGNEQVIIRGRDFRRDPSNSAAIPKVYFNGIEALDVQWLENDNVSELLLVTTPPSKIDGPVDVALVNYDSGAFTYKSYNYEISKPAISAVTPGTINKAGGTKVQINGTGFKKGNLSSLLEGELVDRHLGAGKPAEDHIDTLVIFGDATTGDKKVIDTIVGLPYIEYNDIKITYDDIPSDSTMANIKIFKAGGTVPIKSLDMKVGTSHLFVINGPKDLGDSTIGDEGILVEVTPNQVIITRRISTNAKWENDGLQVTAVAPAVGGIGTRKLYVQNADGGIGAYSINVLNPASNPTIEYISPRNKVKQGNKIIDYKVENAALDLEYYTYTPLSGGAFLTINGADFRKNVKVYMDNRELEIVSRSLNDDQLIVKVPKGVEADLDKLYRILVVNEDGASADSSTLSKPHYIVYKLPQSTPLIESVVPGNTSSKGQNSIRIIGDDFREGVKILIDGIESASVTRISYKELVARVPAGLTPGKKVIQVMNPDFGFGEKKDAINIVSSPEIDSVYDVVKDDELDPVLFSIDGGQNIRLKGRDYLDGIKVILGGTLKAKENLTASETGIPCYDINDAEMVIVGGVEAINVKIENSTSLTFTTPKLKVGDVSIIVVNKDGGVSKEINASYQKPYPDAPTDIDIEVVDSDTIKLEWDKVDGTKYYEIYASYGKSKSSVGDYVYVGSVKAYEISEGRLRYYVDGLKANSWYSFRMKSVNDYGPSGLSYTTDYVETEAKKKTTYYKVEGDYKGGIAQKDKVDIQGSSLTFTAGETSLKNYVSGLIVNLDQTSYTALDPKNVDIGIELLREYPSNGITIKEKVFTLKMLSRNLLTAETTAVGNDKLSDSKITITVTKNLKAKGDEIKLKVPKGYKAITAPAAINITMQVEKTKTNIKTLSGSGNIVFNTNDNLGSLYPGGFYIAYYNNETKKLDILSTKTANKTAAAQITKPGEYVLLGKFTK
jgi:hypothetical protein